MSRWALGINLSLFVVTLIYISVIGGWRDKAVYIEVGFWFLAAFAVVEIVDALLQRWPVK